MSINVISENININDTSHNLILKSNKIFGFWIYLMSDCIVFATLFVTYVVMSHNVANGPSGKEIFNLPFVFIETMILLVSSATYGMTTVYMEKNNKILLNVWMIITFLLGTLFICMELNEFHHLIIQHHGPNRSGFLSAFFTLVGTHGIHVIAGLIWMIVLIIQIHYRGLTVTNRIRIICLSLFWHFLDVIWIIVFSIVYLMGVM